MKIITSVEINRLERAIDAYGIKMVLSALEVICGDKAEHVAVNWQDTTTAKRWEDLASSLGKINSELEEM